MVRPIVPCAELCMITKTMRLCNYKAFLCSAKAMMYSHQTGSCLLIFQTRIDSDVTNFERFLDQSSNSTPFKSLSTKSDVNATEWRYDVMYAFRGHVTEYPPLKIE